MNTSCRALPFAMIMVATLLLGSLGFAQSDQYQRPTKKQSAPAPTTPGAASSATPATPAAAGDAQKVDISDLEKKYWVPKDTEFHVVQNRTYSKAKRFAFTGYIGSLLNDPYSKATITSVSANYYFTERQGVEVSYLFLDSQNSDLTTSFQSNFGGVVPDHNKYRWLAGASYNWVPIYAKLSLLEQKIIYFDMSISPYLGMISYDHQYTDKPTEHETSIAAGIDIAQHFFMSKNFAFRIDGKSRFFNDDVQASRAPYTVKSSKINTIYMVLFGITYYP